MPQLSTSFQTYGVEALPGLLLHFAPKLCQYSYEGMKARTNFLLTASFESWRMGWQKSSHSTPTRSKSSTTRPHRNSLSPCPLPLGSMPFEPMLQAPRARPRKAPRKRKATGGSGRYRVAAADAPPAAAAPAAAVAGAQAALSGRRRFFFCTDLVAALKQLGPAQRHAAKMSLLQTLRMFEFGECPVLVYEFSGAQPGV
ncbi:uncharacterized protein LOC142575561 [Dermacentor variabilis]|uniref:uncharacterized protein LOC142575561 n=1 Tax=Dermacentor variabilis TaxID=34621 RepID=UPI003F5BF373